MFLGVAENAGVSGPLGQSGSIVFSGGVLEYSASNQYDYSGRFSTAANQAYNVNTNGQNVTWAMGLTSSGGSLTMTGAGVLTLTGSNTYSGGTTISTGTLSIGGGGVLGGGNYSAAISDHGTLVVSTSSNQTFGGVISGLGALEQLGSGLTTLTASNTYNGNTTVGGGTLNLGAGQNSASGPLGQIFGLIYLSGGYLQYSAANQYDYSSRFSTAANQAYNVDTNGQSVTWATSLTSSGGSLAKAGGGMLTLTGNDSYGGPTTISGGTLQIQGSLGTGVNSGSYSGTIANSGVLVVSINFNQTFSGVISGSGAVEQLGSNVTTLTAANTYTGATTVGGGTLFLGVAENAGVCGPLGQSPANNPGSIVLGGGSLEYSPSNQNDYSGRFSTAANQAYNVNTNGQNVTWATGLISNGGSLNKAGAGTLTLTGSNTYSGATTISTGTLSIGGGGVLGGGNYSAAISDHGTLVVSTSSNQTFGGVISGLGALEQLGSGLTTLTASNTYNGNTTVGGGTLNLGAGQNSASGPLGQIFGSIYLSGGYLQYSAANQYDYSSRFSTAANQAYNVDTNGQSVTWATSLTSSGGSLAKAGGGMLTLTGDDSYGGPTTISGGTLQIQGSLGTGVNSGSYSGTIANSGVLVVSINFNQTFSGVISGSGAVEQLGSNVTTLTAANTYTGATTVAAGVLKLDFSQTGAPTANIINNTTNASSLAMDAGTLTIQGKLSTTNSQRFNGLAVNPGCSAVVLTTSGAANSLLLSLGSISHSAGGTVDFTLPAGTQTASNGITTTTPNTNGILGGYATVAGTNWATWNGTDIVAYSAYTTSNLGTLASGGTLNVSPSGTQTAITTADSFSSLNLTGSLGVTMSGSGLLKLTSGGLIGNTTGTINGGTLEGSSGTAGNGELIIITPLSLTIGSVIADNGGATGLTKAGPGTLTLTGSNTYSGLTTIGAGTLQVGSTGTLGTGPVTDDSLLLFNRSGVSTFGGTISGFGSLMKIGGGTLILSGSDDYTGGTIVDAGTLQIGSGGTTGSLAGNITDHATLVFNRSDNPTFGGVISGTGSLIQAGVGILTISGGNTYTGGTTISAGSLQIGSGGTTGSLAGNIMDNATLVFNRSDNPTFGGVISGTGSLIQAGAGILTLSGSNSYSGGTTISGGAIGLNNANAVQDSTLTVSVNNDLLFNTGNGAITTFNVGGLAGSGNIGLADGSHALTLSAGGNGAGTTYSGALSGSGGLAKTGSGTLVLCGSNIYTGGTTIAAGTLMLDFSRTGAPMANIINNASNASSLALDGGTLAVQGNPGAANSQQFNGLAVNPGCSAIVLTTSGAANSLLLSLGNISRSAGGTVDFTLPSGTQTVSNGITTTTPNTNGILGGYATVAGTNWATWNGTDIVAYSAYTTSNLGTLASGGTLNVSPSGPQSAITTADSFNSLNLTGSLGVTMSGSGSLKLTSGGLIGNTTGAISGGTLEGSSGTAGAPGTPGPGELIIITPANLTIGSVIANNGGATGLTKAGPGTLTLTGSNTYSGATTIGAGTLQVGGTGTLGTGPVTDDSALLFNPSGVSTFGGVISGFGSLTKYGGGALVLSGSNDYTGGTMVDAGTLYVTTSDTIADGTSLTVGAGGQFVFDPSAAAAPGEALTGAVVAAVPEPGTLLLLAVGALAAGFGVWRRRGEVEPGKY